MRMSAIGQGMCKNSTQVPQAVMRHYTLVFATSNEAICSCVQCTLCKVVFVTFNF